MPTEETKNFLEVFELFVIAQSAKGVADVTLRNYRCGKGLRSALYLGATAENQSKNQQVNNKKEARNKQLPSFF